MLSTRTITGVLEDANGTLLVNTTFYFTPVSGFGAGGAVIPPQPEAVQTDGSGAFSVDLKTLDDASVTYQCTIGQWSFNFDLSPGSPTTLDALLNFVGGPVDPGQDTTIDGGHADTIFP